MAIRSSLLAASRFLLHASTLFRRIVVLGIFSALLAACSTTPIAMSLEQALAEQRVNVEFVNSGTYGDVLIARVTLLHDQSLTLSVPRGTIVRNQANHESLVIDRFQGTVESLDTSDYLPETRFRVSARHPEQLGLFQAYSIDALLEGASEQDAFRLDGMVAPATLAVLNTDTSPMPSIKVRQIAVWLTTNNITTQDLEDLGLSYTPEEAAHVRYLIEQAELDPNRYAFLSDGE